jgi:hypothetical protein
LSLLKDLSADATVAEMVNTILIMIAFLVTDATVAGMVNNIIIMIAFLVTDVDHFSYSSISNQEGYHDENIVDHFSYSSISKLMLL